MVWRCITCRFLDGPKGTTNQSPTGKADSGSCRSSGFCPPHPTPAVFGPFPQDGMPPETLLHKRLLRVLISRESNYNVTITSNKSLNTSSFTYYMNYKPIPFLFSKTVPVLELWFRGSSFLTIASRFSLYTCPKVLASLSMSSQKIQSVLYILLSILLRLIS